MSATLSDFDGHLLLLGCGKMGIAMLDGWLAGGLPKARVSVVEPAEAARAALAERGVAGVAQAAELPPDLAPSVAVLAVKPQAFPAAVPPLAARLGPQCLAISIAAGKTLEDLAALLGAERALIRAMPNTPAAVGRGITALVANAACQAEQRPLAEALLSAVGETLWLEEERLMDPVTALSGGGPAYVFLLIEAMGEAGRKAGLPAEVAARLARSTVSGAGALVDASDESPEQLRVNVTSPGGTTLEALKVLMDPEAGLQPLFDRAIAAASARSRALSGG